MSFDITYSTKDSPIAVPVTVGKTEVWTRVEVGGLIAFAYPFSDTEYDHEVDLYGGQGTIVGGKFVPFEPAKRVDGSLWVQLVRVPTGNQFAPLQFTFTAEYQHVGAVFTPRRFVSSDPKSSSYATHYGIEVMTRSPGIILWNRVTNADRRHKP